MPFSLDCTNHPAQNPDRVSSYSYTETLEDVPDFTMLKFPVTLQNINKFEKMNNISINVYTVEETKQKNKRDDKKENKDGKFKLN